MDARALLRRYGDALLAAVLAVTMTTELVSWAPERLAAAIALGLLSTVPVALRRRMPLVMFLLVGAGLSWLSHVAPGFDNDSMTLVLVFLLALYSVGRHAAGLEAWLGAGLVVLQAALFVQGDVGLTHADLGDIAFTIGFVGAPWVTGLSLRLRQERERVLADENAQLVRDQQLLAERAVAEERARIARELHDVVSHAIAVTVLQARGARATLGRDEAQVRQALDAIEQTNTAALGDMRRLLAVLRDTEPHRDPDDRTPQPSLANLDTLLSHVRGSGVPVEVQVTGDPTPVPPGVDLSAFRIIQESLTNVLKHAGATRAIVCLDYQPDQLRVSVHDDGPGTGHTPSTGGGHGLIGIRERVAVVGGEVDAGPEPHGGYAVRARLPYALELS